MTIMTTDIQKPDLAKKPGTMPPSPSQPPTSAGLQDKKVDKVDQVADRLAHQGSKTEQEFDAEHGGKFVK
jgi:hypothetical protein